ncbi:WD40-repeat-containing domain protein [Ochromonadaceae sp. CCMP2298]|nr:WD40-repeat-containing domain protein [Ochromonadaceae sp. CCMP2298]
MRKEAADAVVAAGEAKEQSAADKLAAEADVEASILEGSSSRNVHILEPDEEEEMWEKVNERKLTYTLPPRPKRGSQMADATSVFHGAELKDYQGRPWSAAPSNVKPDEDGHACFIPRRCIKKLTGHTKGVQALEYLPGTGHLLLSASMDGKCKVWDAHSSEMQVQRTYTGHTEGVRSIHFNNSGSHFLSSGFDRTIRHWDLETGQAAATFSNRKMGYQVRFHPGNNNVFIAACNDNRLYQWDIRTGTVVQEYNHHLQPCNTVTFIDGGRKFVSTSDDKKILVWETDIPVPIKYIAEPGMHCVPSVSMHPSQQFFAAQSMDNKILTYTCGDKVRQQKKKTYTGHNNTGYACQIGFSPNGQFMCSGDGKGEVHFWDWKSTKCYRKFHAHDNGPCMAAVWHPLHPNRVATCGWDGLIKIWD